MKKLFLGLMILTLGVVAACTKTTTTTQLSTNEQGDTTAPGFKNLVNGKLGMASHLKGETFDFLEGISGIDNVTSSSDLVIEVSNMSNYNKDVPGEYVIEYKVTDEAGNFSKALRNITVLDTVEKAFKALIIGETAIPYIGEGHSITQNGVEYTIDNSFDLMPTASEGARFRWLDALFVYSKAKFVELFDAAVASSNYTANGGIPFSGYGGVAFFDANYKPVYLRLARGTAIEVFPDGTVVSGVDAAFQGVSPATTGAGILAKIKESIEIINNEVEVAYIGLVSTPGISEANGLLIKSTFYTEYVTGALAATSQNVDFISLTGKIDDDYKIIVAKPDNIAKPTFTISKNTIYFTGDAGADFYEIYVDGVKSSTTIKSKGAVKHELRLKGNGGLGLENGEYKIQIKAISKDILLYSDSDLSNEVTYNQIDISDVNAPVLSINGNNAQWETITGAVSYDVYVSISGLLTAPVKVGNTTNTTFDLTAIHNQYKNFVTIYVVAIGDNDHYDSAISNKVFYDFAEVQALKLEGYEYPLISTTYKDYFLRRNEVYNPSNAGNGYSGAPYVFYITDFGQYMNNLDSSIVSKITEGYSVTVLLDGTKKVKAVSNIMSNFRYENDSWIKMFEDETEKLSPNAKNLEFMIPSLSAKDSLLIFKNSCNVTAKTDDGSADLIINARHIGAYHFVAKTAKYDDLNTDNTAWNTKDITKLVDLTSFTIAIGEFTQPLAKPVLEFNVETGYLSWASVDGATKYILKLNNELIELATTVNTFDVASKISDWFTKGFKATLSVLGDNRYKGNSSEELVQLANEPLNIKTKSGEDYVVVSIGNYVDGSSLIPKPDTSYDFLADVIASENGVIVENVVVKDNGGFIINKLGIYSVTFEATGAKGNKVIKEITYFLQHTPVWYNKMVVGEKETTRTQGYMHPSHNMFTQLAWTLGQDRMHMFDSQKFLELFKANANKLPILTQGALLVVDHEYNLKALRVSTGQGASAVMFDVLPDGTTKTTDLAWNITDKSMLTGLDTLLNSLSHGGYVIYAPTGVNRTFIFQNFLNPSYTSGIFNPDTITINPYTVKFTMVLEGK